MEPDEEMMLAQLRSKRRSERECDGMRRPASRPKMGQRIADTVATTMGSWRFIIIQSTALALWIVLNVFATRTIWDPFPFILLNLALSFQAAYAAPFIMMSQNRQQELDRKELEEDYQINIKAELEIELLHQKLDGLKECEILMLTEAVEKLTEMLNMKQNASGLG